MHLVGRSRSECWRPVFSSFREQCLDHPGCLVGHGDGGQAEWLLCHDFGCPHVCVFKMSADEQCPRNHPSYEQSFDVPIALLRNPSKLFFATAGPVQWSKAKLGGKVPACFKLLCVANGRDDRRRSDRTDPRDSSQSMATFVEEGVLFD